jgi:hypothetical protein
MNNRNGKWLLAVVALCCLAPAAFADRWDSGGGFKCDPHWQNCGKRSVGPPKAVPEGGSTAIYLLGAGLTCVGAMFLRSRIAKSAQS